jgi:hypothetical protein
VDTMVKQFDLTHVLSPTELSDGQSAFDRMHGGEVVKEVLIP